MRSKRASSFSACSRTASGMPASSILVRYSSTTEASSSPSSFRIESICLRRRNSRCCFSIPALTSSRIRCRICISREPLALEREGELEPLGDVDRLEQLDLLVEAQVGRVAGGVCERAGLADRAEEGLDPSVVAAQLEDLLDDRAVLGLELADALVGAIAVAALLDLDEAAGRACPSRPRPQTRGGAPRARPRSRRRAGGRGRSRARRCRRRRTRPRAWARAARAPRRRRRPSASRSSSGRRRCRRVGRARACSRRCSRSSSHR